MPEISEQILPLKKIENLNDRIKKLCGKMCKIVLTFPSVVGKPFYTCVETSLNMPKGFMILEIWLFSYKWIK